MEDSKDTVIDNISDHLNVVLDLLREYKEIQQVPPKDIIKSLKHPINDENLNPEEPAIIRQDEIDRLRLENHRLLARCELLESGNNVDVTRRIDDAVNQAHEIEELTSKISEYKNREEKIIETLGKKAVELRTAFFVLTGYKVYACKDIVYKIKSLYAEGREDKFVFQLSPQGKIRLIEDDYTRRFSKHISNYLSNGADHFPAFMASVTLDLFHSSSKAIKGNR